MPIVPSNGRIELIKSLLPDANFKTSKAALKVDRFLESVILNPLPHNKISDAIAVGQRSIRAACSHDKKLERVFKQCVLVSVGKHSAELNARSSIPYQVNPEFKVRYYQAIRDYEPTVSHIRAPQVELEHPFLSMVPVNLQAMKLADNYFGWWLEYLNGDVDDWHPTLKPVIDTIRSQETARPWAGQFKVNSENWQHCPLKTSPRERIVERVNRLHAALKIMIEVAINNDGCVPMNYRVSGNSPRWYTTGGIRSLQTCPAVVREICLSGGFEYDIESCNQTIALHYAQHNDLKHAILQALVSDKDAVLSCEAKTTGLSTKSLKTALLAIGNLSDFIGPNHAERFLYRVRYDYNAVTEKRIVHDLVKIVWRECGDSIPQFHSMYTALYESEFVQTYQSEMKAIAEHMAENLPGFNLRKPAASITHYNQSIEVQANLAMYRAMPSATVSIFDAVTVQNPEDLEHAQHQMQTATGINFTLKKSVLTIPIAKVKNLLKTAI